MLYEKCYLKASYAYTKTTFSFFYKYVHKHSNINNVLSEIHLTNISITTHMISALHYWMYYRFQILMRLSAFHIPLTLSHCDN